MPLLENTTQSPELSDYKALSTSNGKDGLDVALEPIPDLIVSDVENARWIAMMCGKIFGNRVHFFISVLSFFTLSSEQKDIQKGMQMGDDDIL